MTRGLRFGVLGTAKIAREKVIPALGLAAADAEALIPARDRTGVLIQEACMAWTLTLPVTSGICLAMLGVLPGPAAVYASARVDKRASRG